MPWHPGISLPQGRMWFTMSNMKSAPFERMSPEQKERIAYVEGREDLFETKLLRIKSAGEARKNLLVAARDPGSGNALVPVLQELVRDLELQVEIITDGRAKGIFQDNFQTEDITPKGSILAAETAIGNPNAILMDKSSSEMGLDTYTAANFAEVPKILVEDFYASSIDYLSALVKRDLPLPKKICVMDEEAKRLILQQLPQLEEIIEVTGQPAFDKFAREDTDGIAREVKSKLGLREADKLVTFMSTIDDPAAIADMAQALRKTVGDFSSVFRRHPRDNVSYETYKEILNDAGIKIIDTNDLSTNDVGAASDVIMTSWSTEGLVGIYRRKPTLHVISPSFKIPENLMPPPPVKLGASIGVERVEEIAEVLPQLLNEGSPLNEKLRENMERYYPADGKNAERVADVVRRYL